MDLTTRQRQLAFVVIVIVLAGLGIYLFRAHAAGSGTGGHAAAPPASPTGAAAPTAAASAQPATVATPSAAPTTTGGQADIYQWLPFSQADLTAAATAASRFGADYGSYSYLETPTAYVAKMGNLVTSQLAASLARAFATPGVAQARSHNKEVSAGQAQIDSLRAFGPASMTFVVTVNESISEAAKQQQTSGQYAVTVTKGGGSWQVSDIQLASAGNS